MDITSLIRAGRKFNASDIHVVVGVPPLFRIDGDIVTSKGGAITSEMSKALAYERLNEEQKHRLDRDLMICLSVNCGDLSRSRVSVYFRNGNPELSIRLSEPHVRTREELGLPPIVDELARKPSGLVVITGPTGVGKTTTMHYLIDLINSERRSKIRSEERRVGKECLYV